MQTMPAGTTGPEHRIGGAPSKALHKSLALESVLYSFKGDSGSRHDGAHPEAPLRYMRGGLFGTTYVGGAHDGGTIFSITTSGKEAVVHSFGGYNNNDGLNPDAGLTDSGFGTTEYGGTANAGTAYHFLTSGYEEVLHSFGNGYDGSHPAGGVIERSGTLYGTTGEGGAELSGTVFSIAPHDSNTENVIYGFSGGVDGGKPMSELTDIDGTLYGTTLLGGSSSKGVVFGVTTGGSAKRLHEFSGGNDGAYPMGGLIDVAGSLYGTATAGGGSACGGDGCGVVFKITPDGTYRILHMFTGGHEDGSAPSSRLLFFNNVLYGTTDFGGKHSLGTIYSIKPDGTAYTLVYSFKGGSDGALPYAGLIDVDDVLFGTTYNGGASNLGTVFVIKP